MLRVCLSGLGKTGIEIAKVLLDHEDLKLVSVLSSPNSSKRGKDIGEILGLRDTGIIVESSENLEEVVFRVKPDVVLDFSSPEAAIRNARKFSKMKVNLVIGTTGFTKFSQKRLFAMAHKYHNGIVYAPNITLGVNVMMLLTNLAASLLSDYDFHITEIHHRQKKDSPSGTAIKIAAEIEKGIKNVSKDETGSWDLNIPITAVRAGGVVGKHEVLIIGENDKIQISHESFSRRAFANGALYAARFVYGKTGYFEMSDVLNLKSVLEEYMDKEHNSLNRKYLKSLLI